MKWIGTFALMIFFIFVVFFIIELFSTFIQRFGWWKIPFKKSGFRKFDLFPSYKTEDSEFVRPIVDNLIANGISVWFAEYSLIAKYSLRILDEHKIDSLCLEGAKSSAWGLFFFNDRYSKSFFCQEELKILKLNTDRLIRVDLPCASKSINFHNPTYSVKIINQIQYTSLKDIIQFVYSRLKTRTKCARESKESIAGMNVFEISHYGINFQIDFSDWEKSPRNVQDLKSTSHDYVGPDLRKIVNGRRTILLWSIGPDYTSSKRKTSESSESSESIGIDDRAFRKEMIQFAHNYFKGKMFLRPVGIHLIEIDGYYHYIYTYWNWISLSWVRRYSIFLPHPTNPSQNWEYIFHFTYYGNFKDYCLSSEYFDQIIKSMKVGPV